MILKKVTPKNQAIESIRAIIINNNLQPGSMLPSERELSNILKLSRTTIRTALSFLEDENDIYRIPSAGNFVGTGRISVDLTNIESTTSYIQQEGGKPSSFVISWRVYEANNDMAKIFNEHEKITLFELIRIRYVNDEPYSYDVSNINYKLCPGIENYDFSERSLFNVLDEEFGVSLSHGSERISISYATDIESLYLQIPKKSNVFYVKGKIFNKQNEVVEYIQQVIRHDKISYEIEMNFKGIKNER